MARRRSTRRGRGEGTVFERSNGTWAGEVTTGYDENGKQKRKTVYGKTQAEALAKLGEVKQQLATGTFTDTKLTVKAYLEQWLTHKERQVKPRTAELYRHVSEYHIMPRIGRRRLDKLTPLDVQGMVEGVAANGSIRTANQCRTVLFSALKQAIRWQLLARNPVEAVDALKETPREMTLWTPEEVVRFLDTARAHRLYPLFYLALSTGMRGGELLGLRWQDVNGSIISIRQTLVPVGNKIMVGTPKTKKGQRRVSVSPDVLEVLALHKAVQEAEHSRLGEAWADSGLVFPTEIGTPMHPRNLERTWYTLQDKARDAWQAASEEAGDVTTLEQLAAHKLLPRARLHDLRHLHVSLLVKRGVDARTIADRVGHTRASFTLDVYTHLFEEQRTAAAVSLLDLLPKGDPSTAN